MQGAGLLKGVRLWAAKVRAAAAAEFDSVEPSSGLKAFVRTEYGRHYETESVLIIVLFL